MTPEIVYAVLLTISASFGIAAIITYVNDGNIHHRAYWSGRVDGFNSCMRLSTEFYDNRVRLGLKLCRVIRFGRNKNLKRWEPVE